MPRAHSTDLRARVVAAMQAGGSCRAVAASFDFSPSTAGKWHRAFSRSGSVSPARIGGCLGSPLEPLREWIWERVRARPGITVRELARGANARFGLSVGRDAVWRFLTRRGPVFKKVTCVAGERDRGRSAREPQPRSSGSRGRLGGILTTGLGTRPKWPPVPPIVAALSLDAPNPVA